MWKLLDFSVSLFQVIVIIQTITQYLGAKHSDFKGKLLALTAVIILFAALNSIDKNISFFEGLAVIVPMVIIFLYSVIALQGSWKEKLYCSVLVMVIIIGITAFVMNLTGILCGYTYADLMEVKDRIHIISLLIIQVLILLFTRIFLYKRSDNIRELSWDTWLITIVIPIISVMTSTFILEISLHTADGFKKHGLNMAVFASLAIFAVNILTCLSHSRQKKYAAEYALLKQRYNIQKQDIEDVKQLYSHLQKLKHDAKHHINLLIILLKKDKIHEALNYLMEYSNSEYVLNSHKIFCDNMILNYVVNMKAQIMEEQKIAFAYTICENIEGIADIDLNIVLSNLLDNAIEACKKVRDEEKEITLSIYKRADYLIIRIENTFNPILDHLKDFQTTKENKEEHGFGLWSVKEISKKYKGRLDIRRENNRVIAVNILETHANQVKKTAK